MHSNAYSTKRAKKCQKMVTNGKNIRKLKIIAKFQKLLNMVKKLQKLTKMSNNVKNAKNGPKTDKKWQHLIIFFSSYFWLENTSKNGTSHFHTMFGSRDTHFRSFLAKIRIFGSKFQPNQNLYS